MTQWPVFHDTMICISSHNDLYFMTQWPVFHYTMTCVSLHNDLCFITHWPVFHNTMTCISWHNDLYFMTQWPVFHHTMTHVSSHNDPCFITQWPVFHYTITHVSFYILTCVFQPGGVFLEDRLGQRVQKIEDNLCSQEPALAQLLNLDCLTDDTLSHEKEKQLRWLPCLSSFVHTNIFFYQ